MQKKHLTVATYAACLCSFALLICIFSPFKQPNPIYLDNALQLFHHHSYTAGNFLPVGYTTILFYSLHLGGLNGVFCIQALAYLASGLIIYQLIRPLKLSPTTCFILAILISLQPYLLLNIKRINDAAIYLPLFLYLCYSILHKPATKLNTMIISGLLFGLLIMIRPNLIPLVGLWAVMQFNHRQFMTQWKPLLALIISLIISIILFSLPTGKVGLILPHNGAYNMLVGANPYTAQTLKQYQDAESSLQHLNLTQQIANEHPKYGDIKNLNPNDFRQLALQFIVNHPWQYLKLIPLKLWVFLSPEKSETQSGAMQHTTVIFFLKILSSLPVPLWLLLIFSQRPSPYTWRVILIIALYTLPFILLSSTPRYRLPMTILTMVDSLRLITPYFMHVNYFWKRYAKTA